jgi:hypothetical protein
MLQDKNLGNYIRVRYIYHLFRKIHNSVQNQVFINLQTAVLQ